MNLENYLACEEFYPIVIQNACTTYAIKHLHEKFNGARRAANTILLHAFSDEPTLRRNICGWVRAHLEEKVVELDLVDRIMMDIKWSTVLNQIRDIVNEQASLDSDSDNENVEEPPLPAPRIPRRQRLI
jgi:hypothetical protein